MVAFVIEVLFQALCLISRITEKCLVCLIVFLSGKAVGIYKVAEQRLVLSFHDSRLTSLSSNQ